jgi:hypothetical protein
MGLCGIFWLLCGDELALRLDGSPNMHGGMLLARGIIGQRKSGFEEYIGSRDPAEDEEAKIN